ncbi:MBL fold metallo-hydrolase [Streptacidiphilus rugosus]|uniref:MBL fold metallo-hydrolase n=1 Tax=Streptacidiphilus rugosus TaxID=405783 RepID=UPI00056A895D|nr:MBL fold metallo-hydrolase [Streptacidiphilus rugosus]
MAKPAAYQLAPNVWRIPAGPFDFVNAFVLLDDDGQVTLVDTGMASSGGRIEAGLALAGKGLSDITRIVLTHAHGDHAGGAARIAEQSGAGVSIHEIDAPFAREGKAPPRDQSTFLGRMVSKQDAKKPAFPPVIIGEEFKDGDVLPIAGGLRVVHTPGHSPGHVALLAETTGVLITGDSIWNIRRMKWSVKAFCQDIRLNRQTAHVLGELDYQIAAFTHGKHVSEQAREKVRGFLRDAEALKDA